MRRTLTAVVLLAVAALSACTPNPIEGTDTPDEVGGDYFVNGTDPRGTEYSGQLTITEVSRTGQYDLQWIITGSVQTGSGRFDGEILEADWETVSGAFQAQGTIVYELQDDGRLVGVRTQDGFDEEGEEEAFPVDLSG